MKIQFLLIYLQLICNMNLYIEDSIIVYHSLVVLFNTDDSSKH